jgi:DNA (cytosine-5)-methyltransferase 1
MKYLSTFSGIGGFELGIQLAYVDSIKRGAERRFQENQAREKRQGFQSEEGEGVGITEGQSRSDYWNIPYKGQPTCVGYSEIDKYASAIYQKHFPNHHNYGDITQIVAEDLHDFDLLVGGFPCQAFSIAGKRGGFEDTRGTMFFELARILRAKQPRLFVFENVKGLLSHDGGKSFATIIQTLDELGYDTEWQVLNSKNHGVPQNRERVFIVGHLRGTPRPQVFPFGETTGTALGDCQISNSSKREFGFKEVSPTLLSRDYKDPKLVQLNNPTHSNDRVYGADGISPTLNTMQGGMRQPFVKDEVRIRRLTPVECERLQGFPDGWTEGVSDTQRYKTLGNAVTVNVIRDLFIEIYKTT